MATLRTKMVRYAFNTRITQLATGVALGTPGSRHDFAAITLDIPETGSRTFLSVMAVVTWRDAWTVATTFPLVRIGSKLGAAAFVDVDRAGGGMAHTGDHTFERWTLDITDNFAANFGAGASQTCQIGIEVTSGIVSAIDNITCELWITYQFDDDVGSTRVKTIGIPIQSHSTSIGNSHVEIGTTGGTAGTNAPANQIPILDDVLVESSKSIKQAYLALEGIENATATTDVTPFVQIDATAEMQRATLEQALQTSVPWKDVILYDTTTFSTASAHALKFRTDVSSRMLCVGGMLWVTYTYDRASANVTCQQWIPLTQMNDDDGVMCRSTSFNSTDVISLIAEFDIEETGPITMLQSGFVGYFDNFSAGGSTNIFIACGSQTLRQVGGTTVGMEVGFVHRGDHSSSGWTLARGRNRLDVRLNVNFQFRVSVQGYASVLYSAATPATGTESIARIAAFNIAAFTGSSGNPTDVATTGQRAPVFNTDGWSIQGLSHECSIRTTMTGAFTFHVTTEVLANEWGNVSGLYPFKSFALSKLGNGSAELMCWRAYQHLTRSFNRTHNRTGKLSPTTARRWVYLNGGTQMLASWQWITFHSITFTVSGTITINGAPVADGKTVNIYTVEPDGTTELSATVVTSGGAGGFSAKVTDNTRTYWASYDSDGKVGRSHLGTPT